MSLSVLSINGRELQVPSEIAHRIYRLIHEVVAAGDTKTVVVDTEQSAQPGKLVLLVNPSTQAFLYTNDVAAMSLEFYDANVVELLRFYIDDDTDAPQS